MNLSFKLISFREYRKWSVEYVALELGISTETYNQLEGGRVKINGIIAEKLSDLYQAPKEFFIVDDTQHHIQSEIIYSNCSFGGGSHGYVNHQYNDRGIDEILFAKKEEIKYLKQQIEEMYQQYGKMVDLLRKG